MMTSLRSRGDLVCFKGKGAQCEYVVLYDKVKEEGVLIPSTEYEGSLLPIKLSKGKLTEVPWCFIKSALFTQSIKEFKTHISEMCKGFTEVDNLNLDFKDLKTLKISGLDDGEVDENLREKFKSIFFTNTEHQSEALYLYPQEGEIPSSITKSFRTCRGSKILLGILKENSLKLETEVFDF